MSLPINASNNDVLADIFPEGQNYSDGEIIAESSEQDAKYTLGLGALQKIHGVWRHKKSIRLTGNLVRLTYQIPSDRKIEEVIKNLKNSLSSYAIELYKCKGRSCGSSAQWASVTFKKRELYGLDNYQHYLAYRLPFNSGVYFVAIYGVKRANDRLYLHLDILENPNIKNPLQSSVIAEKLEKSEIFPILDVSRGQIFNEVQLQSVVGALAKFEGVVALICHCYGEGSAQDLLGIAKKWCQKVRDQLIESGVKSSQLITLGAGPLQPFKGLNDRLELLAP